MWFAFGRNHSRWPWLRISSLEKQLEDHSSFVVAEVFSKAFSPSTDIDFLGDVSGLGAVLDSGSFLVPARYL